MDIKLSEYYYFHMPIVSWAACRSDLISQTELLKRITPTFIEQAKYRLDNALAKICRDIEIPKRVLERNLLPEYSISSPQDNEIISEELRAFYSYKLVSLTPKEVLESAKTWMEKVLLENYDLPEFSDKITQEFEQDRTRIWEKYESKVELKPWKRMHNASMPVRSRNLTLESEISKGCIEGEPSRSLFRTDQSKFFNKDYELKFISIGTEDCENTFIPVAPQISWTIVSIKRAQEILD